MNRFKGWLVCGLLLAWLLLAACSGPMAQDASLLVATSTLVDTDSSEPGATATIPNTLTPTPSASQSVALEPTAQPSLTPEPTEIVEPTTTLEPAGDTEEIANESAPSLQYETRYWQGQVEIRGVGEGEEAWRVVETSQIPLIVDTTFLTPELAEKVDARAWLAKLTNENGTITEVVEQHLRLDRSKQQVLTDEQGNQIGYEVGSADNRFRLRVNQITGETSLTYSPTILDELTKDIQMSYWVYNTEADESGHLYKAVNQNGVLIRSKAGDYEIRETPFTAQEILKTMAANSAAAAYRGINGTWGEGDLDISPIVEAYGDILEGVDPGASITDQLMYFYDVAAPQVLVRAFEQGELVMPDYEMYQMSDGQWRKRTIVSRYPLTDLMKVQLEVRMGYNRWSINDLPPVVDGNTKVPDQIGDSHGYDYDTQDNTLRAINYTRMPRGDEPGKSWYYNAFERGMLFESGVSRILCKSPVSS